MFIEFQHPLLDLRPIIDGSQMISCPNWHEPYEGDAIRFTGIVKSRLKGGISHFKGENLFCTTYRAVRFPNLNDSGTEIEFDNGAFVKNKGLFRHLNSDGEFLVKYESGFGNKFEDFYTKENESHKGVFFKKILDKSCDIVAEIGIKEKVVTNIIESGPFLAKQYLYSTTKGFDKTSHLEFIKDWWINAGNPMLLVIYFDNDNFIELPKHTIKVKEYKFEEVTLYHYWVLKKGKPKIRTWIIKCNSYSDEHFIRQLRLNLLRINAEIEILKLLTITLDKKKDIISKNENIKEKLDEYLEKVSSKLLKKIRYGNEQKDFLEFALEANYHVNPTDVTSYFDTLKVIRNKYALQNLKTLKIIGS